VNVIRVREKDMTAEMDGMISAIQRLAFPHEPDFVSQRWHHTAMSPDDLWFVIRGDGGLLASVRLVHRTVLAGGRRLAVVGVANVCSHPESRGKGAARACMQAAQEHIAGAGGYDFGLLFTAPEIKEFYRKLGWTEIANEIIARDGSGSRTAFKPAVTMVFPAGLKLSDWPDAGAAVDLGGQDW